MDKVTTNCSLCAEAMLVHNPLRAEQGYCLNCEELLAWDQQQSITSQGTRMIVNAVPTNGYGIRQATVWSNKTLSSLADLDGQWANIRAFKPNEELNFLAIAGKLSWEDGILQFEALNVGDYDEQRFNALTKKPRPQLAEALAQVKPPAPVILSVEEIHEDTEAQFDSVA